MDTPKCCLDFAWDEEERVRAWQIQRLAPFAYNFDGT
jgi:hypothetical protein